MQLLLYGEERSGHQSDEHSPYGGCALPQTLQCLLYLLSMNTRKGTLAGFEQLYICALQARQMEFSLITFILFICFIVSPMPDFHWRLEYLIGSSLCSKYISHFKVPELAKYILTWHIENLLT